MFKKIFLFILALVIIVLLAENFAKDMPFVQKSNAFVIKQFERCKTEPVMRQWNKVAAYFERLKKKAGRKKAQEEAMKTGSSTKSAKKAPPPAKRRQRCTGKGPNSGRGKTASKRLWRDDKGNYEWKDKDETYDWRF